ncbi:MAG: helix-turn-helix domain-containing protein [Candidatus Altiarchaeota archaeon]
MKSDLTERVLSLLDEAGFQVVDCTGSRSSFDIIAKRGEVLFLVKILKNIEGLNRFSANELKNVASLLSGIPFVIGEGMKNSMLSDDVVYDRYGICVSSPTTFERIINNMLPSIYSTRGNYCVKIDSKHLSELRHKSGLTQDALAKRLNVSKQSVYRYEREGRVSLDVFERLIDLFEDEGLALPGFEMEFQFNGPESRRHVSRHVSDLKKVVLEEFRNMGFKTSMTNAPFDIYASKDEMILTVVSNDWRRLKHRIEMMRDITSMVGGYSVCISERHVDIDGSVIRPEELHEIHSPKDFFKLLSEDF